ncbi:MAG TPA: pyridoxamine 5'-phosphate oxidase family protein [Candidatus Paceibacterota bacterium]|nr:pyridoxamine 5'-phosphate oxidase family protein [Candidatus Paceibacterota bacterium]
MEEQKRRILEFLKAHRLTVIATVDTEHNRPEAAVIAFAEKESLDLIFGTSNKTRKYRNIQNNPEVSFVIGWSDELGTVQYEGIATELSGDEAIEHGTILADKNENARIFLSKADQRYFLVKPSWIRMVDKSVFPEERFELGPGEL